ncbi:MAG: hypothetical protein WCO61_03010 [Alphaproteobacteria bacterium]
MAVKTYYGESFGKTVLEIYTENKSKNTKITHRRLEDQDAYDTWHLSYYLKEILRTRNFINSGVESLEKLERKDKNLISYLILASNPDLLDVVEIGSSLFEMIDGLRAVNEFSKNKNIFNLDLENFNYVGIELSNLLRDATRNLYPNHKIKLYETVDQFQEPIGFLCDRSVTNYALETCEELSDLMNRAQVCYLNTYFSKKQTFITSRLGKKVTYFSLQDVCKLSTKPIYHIYGEKAPGPFSGEDISRGNSVLEGFFICANEARVLKFFEYANLDPEFSSFFLEKNIKMKLAKELVE